MTQRWAFVRAGVVRLSRLSLAAPSEVDTRRWVFGDAEDAGSRSLAGEGAWQKCPDGVGEDWTVDGLGVFTPPEYLTQQG